MFVACDNNFDYVIHGQGEKEYIVTEPDAEIWIQSFRQPAAYDEIDILWVIDGSCSMMTHKASVLNGIEVMMNRLPTDINWRLKMITTGDGRAVPQPKTFPLTRGDTIQDALDMYNALPPDGMEKGFSSVFNYITLDSYAQTWIRPDAALLTVFVSDEEEQSTMTAVDFQAWYQGIKPNVFLSFIGNVYAKDSVCTFAPAGNSIGVKYMNAVNYFSGIIVDICESDWSAGVEDATQKIEPFEDIELDHEPYKNTIVVFEDGVPMDGAKWKYIEADNLVEFDPIPANGALVEVSYAVKYYNL
tara:strand:+ start:83 stop:985 length:903 start_codon:yes stop_codon:yes gene_type:complete